MRLQAAGDDQDVVDRLSAGMANLPLFVTLRRAVDPAGPSPALLARHLEWMVAQEAAGHVFASGPFESEGAARGAAGGLTVLRAADEAAARAVADADPFVRAGLVAYELKRWRLIEGDLQIRVRLSQRGATLA